MSLSLPGSIGYPVTQEFSATATPINGADVTLPMGYADVSNYGSILVQIRNTGANPLTALKIQSILPQGAAAAIDLITESSHWVVGSLLQFIDGTPFTLAAGADASILINTQGHHNLRFLASSGAATTINVYGFGQGG